MRWAVLGTLLALAGACGWVAWRAYEFSAAYPAANRSIDHLRSLSAVESASTSIDRLTLARADLQELKDSLQQLDDATALPIGEPIARQLIWIGPRYAAVRDLVRMGQLSVDAGTLVTQIGEDLLRTLDTTDVNQPPGVTPSWLDAISPYGPQLVSVVDDIRTIQAVRARIDDRVLPARVRTRLGEIDRILESSQVQALMSMDLAATEAALGETAPARYLVVFQNPAELRPTGGFPGTMALLTLDHGKLVAYEFFDAHELTDVYLAHRQTVLPQPWPIERFFPQTGFLLHDSLWWPDFPRSAKQLMAMYAETGWPTIAGVVAVQPEVASTLVGVTGPFTVDFQGQQRRVTADNLYSEIERQRVQTIEKPEDLLVHKEMLGLIGKSLIERLKNADRNALMRAGQQLAVACRRRDVQVYVSDPVVETELDRQQCTGRLLPVDGQPTLAVAFANLALSKTSMAMQPRLTLTTGAPQDGQRPATLNIDVQDLAAAEEDPVYAGFQRWWVEITLPEGSSLLSERGPMDDPGAPNGGSYVAELFPGMSGRISVRFSMPDEPSLLIRRQPGLRTAEVSVSVTSCEHVLDTQLDEDVLVDVRGVCA
ncbi:MAG: DUF4012 domain-containing protein [Chloroflexota bacterium]